MNTLRVRNMELGTGIPKICVPIVGVSKEDILSQAKALLSTPVDMVEWRADWFDGVADPAQVTDVLAQLRIVLGNLPLLFTFRSNKEGGQRAMEPQAYAQLNIQAAQSGYVDLVDVEAFSGEEIVRSIIQSAHAAGVKVIVSNHDFCQTPSKDEIVSRLRRMQDFGADIPKIAVMPQSKEDVLTLLSATQEMVRLYAHGPIITMSMGGTGVISRLCGEVFGSAVTFGAAQKASAPGQMGVEQLHTVLTLLHNAQ
ncbi:type I 3-dehydroquinate dehydratase [Pseudoflavonifractor capillosus]|uniref:type I 3-dehydroquinate dehydratase n=1 Tax=Pseudoflavonifractor capillosus TaxID=106588 RepID=UPI00195E9CCD|nr:type I 3-dehydroquinate dehydratase [Pseudoflavonifractor capillosus]MBM6895797.1 type I 3-dehydroquinate dehydratase [Pseudoflavonifractor capillosus]